VSLCVWRIKVVKIMEYNPRLSPFYKMSWKDILFHPVIIGVTILIIGKIAIFGMPDPSKYEQK